MLLSIPCITDKTFHLFSKYYVCVWSGMSGPDEFPLSLRNTDNKVLLSSYTILYYFVVEFVWYCIYQLVVPWLFFPTEMRGTRTVPLSYCKEPLCSPGVKNCYTHLVKRRQTECALVCEGKKRLWRMGTFPFTYPVQHLKKRGQTGWASLCYGNKG